MHGDRPQPLVAAGVRAVAESFGAAADAYDRARPRYPGALVTRILEGLPGHAVLDVGVGTGIAARQFQAAGATVLGLDPDERMAEVARQSGVPAEVGRFEEWDPAGRQFDAVIAAQAWHWVDPVAGARAAARVVRPGGRWAVFWNAGDPAPDLAAEFAALYRRLLPANLPFDLAAAAAAPAARGYQALAAKAADGVTTTGAFEEPERWEFEWEHEYTKAAWLDQLPTLGAFTRLPPAVLAPILDAVATVIDQHGGHVPVHYTTIAATARRRQP